MDDLPDFEPLTYLGRNISINYSIFPKIEGKSNRERLEIGWITLSKRGVKSSVFINIYCGDKLALKSLGELILNTVSDNAQNFYISVFCSDRKCHQCTEIYSKAARYGFTYLRSDDKRKIFKMVSKMNIDNPKNKTVTFGSKELQVRSKLWDISIALSNDNKAYMGEINCSRRRKDISDIVEGVHSFYVKNRITESFVLVKRNMGFLDYLLSIGYENLQQKPSQHPFLFKIL